jgi:hypothetical protein
MDFDTNRILVADPRDRNTGSATVTADLRFARAMENSLVTLEPSYTWRRFTNQRLGNGDDRGIGSAWQYSGERWSSQLSASYSDQSTLTSELLETGLVNVDTHRRLSQASLSWNYSQAELRQLVTQASYQETSYYGPVRYLLPGFRYAAQSVGERFNLNETTSLTTSLVGDQLTGRYTPSSHEYGAQVELIHAFGERTHFDGSVGETSRVLAGKSSKGTNISVSLTHDMPRSSASLAYVRSLTPYGIGYLVERKQATLQDIYHLTTYLDANIQLIRVDNSENVVLLGLDRRNFMSVSTGLTWRPTETFNLGFQFAVIQAPATQPVGPRLVDTETLRDWRTAIRATWTPLPFSVSR